jgi:hypothetical protein
LKLLAVTTFNRAGYDRYAHKMLDGWANWPASIDLLVLAEDCAEVWPGAIDLLAAAPAIARFKAEFGDRPRARGMVGGKYNYRFDAVRFCHKVFALEFAVAVACCRKVDALIWIDADTVTHRPIPLEFVEGLLPADADVACLKRSMAHSETGFVIFRANTPGFGIIRRMASLYRTGQVFQLPQWHDAFVFDDVRLRMEHRQGLRSHSLSGGFEHAKHPFVNGPLGAYMDHLKGDSRKDAGRSLAKDLKHERPEEWWRSASFV